ncbi:hypothetical protein Tco_0711020 [Tanacetum coccineum]
MCTYLNNMEGYKLKDLKAKGFDSIQEMFDKAFKRVNTFKDFRTELVEGKEKRAGTELAQEITKKQSDDMEKFKARYIGDSTCESEYILACEASKEAIWMKNFIRDLGVVPTVQDPIEIFCDNESAVTLTKEPKDHEKSKHIERKYHFVRSKVEEGHVIVKHIRSEDNRADPFTKALAKSRHDEHARSIGLKDNIKF